MHRLPPPPPPRFFESIRIGPGGAFPRAARSGPVATSRASETRIRAGIDSPVERKERRPRARRSEKGKKGEQVEMWLFESL